MLEQTLPGTTTSTTFIASGTQVVCLVPIIDGIPGPQACCTVSCTPIAPIPPQNFTCVTDADCNTVLTWTNPVPYSQIVVTVNGIPKILSGNTTSDIVALPFLGQNSVFITATTICGDVTAMVDCGAGSFCPRVPLPPTDVACTLDDACIDCSATVTWLNGEAYDSIRVFIGGVLQTTLPGTETSYAIPAAQVPVDPTDVCIVGVIDGFMGVPIAGTPGCCTISCPPMDPLAPTGLVCTTSATCVTTLVWNNPVPYSEIRVKFGGVVVQTLPGTATTTTLNVDPGQNEVAIEATTVCGVPTPMAMCTPGSVFCGASPLPPSNLICVLMDPCVMPVPPGQTGCMFTATWTNAALYDSINVYLDGVLQTSLAGNATSYDFTTMPGTTSEICIEPVVNNVPGLLACDIAFCPLLDPAPPVIGVRCMTDANCNSTVTWTNPVDYAEIRVYVNDILAQTLAGTTMATIVNLPLTGPNLVEIEATTVCGDVTVRVPCLANDTICTDPAPPPTALTCVIPDPCICAVDMAWVNSAIYDEIRVLIEGLVVETLPGDATSLMRMVPPGVNQICLEAVVGGIASPVVCCTVECAPVEPLPPTGFICTTGPNCNSVLTWTNPVPYQTIMVIVNGVIIETLPGTATTTDVMLLPGVNVVSLSAITICDDETPTVTCPAAGSFCDDTPDPVFNLVCQLDDPCTCASTVMWNNAEPYDELDVFVDGVLVETFAAPMIPTTYPITPDNGATQVCLVPRINGVDGLEQCCSISCPILPPTAPTGVRCVTDANCNTLVTWQAPVPYALVNLKVNGVVVQTVDGSVTSATVALPMPGQNEVCVEAMMLCPNDQGVQELLETCCLATETFCDDPPLPVTNLLCNVMDSCLCMATLVWQNNGMYDTLNVRIDGNVVDTIQGDLTTLDLMIPNGTSSVCLEPVINGLAGAETCCEVTCHQITPLAPTDLVCATDANCVTSLTWTNPVAYSEIRVSLEGVLVETLPGAATMASVPVLPGANEVSIEATTICGDVTPIVLCTALGSFCPAKPGPVTNLTCTVDEPCPADVGVETATVTWNNPEPYDEIRVLIGGNLQMVLPAGSTSFSFAAPLGMTEVCIEGVINEVEGAPNCCIVDRPPIDLVPPAGIRCTTDMNCNTVVTWSNPVPFETIEVLVNGVVVQTLPGSATMTTVMLPEPGQNMVCLRASTICSDGVFSVEACCVAEDVFCTVRPAPPTEVICTVDPCTCIVTVTWLNGATYDSIRVLREGQLETVIGGGETSTQVTLTPGGSDEICLEGVVNGLESLPGCCLATCPLPGTVLPVSNVFCQPMRLDDGCQVRVTWENPQVYDMILVTMDGGMSATLPGTDTMVDLPWEGVLGIPEICIIGIDECGASAEPACCNDYASDCDADGIANVCEPDCDGDGNPDDCEVEPDCNMNGLPDDCDIDSGLELDCNRNGIPDSCEIERGQVEDCDQNGVPDSCDIADGVVPDCNGNGIPDSCDIATGTSLDVDLDMIPDECAGMLPFVRGDVDSDGAVSLSDPIASLLYLFAGGPEPGCMDSGDFDADGGMGLPDVILSLTYLFIGGDPPAAPGATCGTATPMMGCQSSACP